MGNGKSDSGSFIKKIGIARTLVYFLDYFDWQKFFRILNCRVIISDASTHETFRRGFAYSSNDQCFPVKVFLGHILGLRNKVDHLFIPQLVSLRKGTFSCPKIIALPMLVKNTINDLPPVLSVSIDVSYPILTYLRVVWLAWKTSKNPIRIFGATKFFMSKFREYLSRKSEKKVFDHRKGDCIVILGHRYALRDEFLSLRLIKRIKEQGLAVVTSEELESNSPYPNDFFSCGPVHWDFGQNLISAAQIALNESRVKGVIFLTYFGCGIDAFVEEVFKLDVSKNKPYLCLLLDEHSGEAGVNTRIEAFIDMIKRKGEVLV